MSHPYISGAGSVGSMIDQLRKAFPATVDAGIVKKLGLAPKNESFVINALQFVGAIDENGKKTDEAAKTFSLHKDDDFHASFESMVKSAYSELFDLHGEDAWKLGKPDLVTFFRSADQTSEVIGGRQAALFQVFAHRSGKLADAPQTKSKSKSNPGSIKPAAVKVASASKAKKATIVAPPVVEGSTNSSFGLSVRVEINLPSDASAETYDNIFKSIKKNLMP